MKIAMLKAWKEGTEWQRDLITQYQRMSDPLQLRGWKEGAEWQRDLITQYQRMSDPLQLRGWKEGTEYQRNLITQYQRMSDPLQLRGWKEGTEYQRDLITQCQRMSDPLQLRGWKEGTEWQRNLITQYQRMSDPLQLRGWKEGTEWQRNLITQCQHGLPTPSEAIKRARDYAKQHNLEIKRGVLYAYRNHDQWGRGIFKKNIYYVKGKLYRDWHCDPRQDVKNSFGFGIWPEGNTPVAVPLKDFVVAVDGNDGKARVLAFKVIGEG